MKTWTNPTVEELEVEQTAGGRYWWLWESYWTDPTPGNNNNNNNGGDDENDGGDSEEEETTNGMS